MRPVTCILVHLAQTTSLAEELVLKSTLCALTNIAALSNWHKEMGVALHRLYQLLDEGLWQNEGISYQSLRLLIKLSCNEKMVPFLLAAQVSPISTCSVVKCQ